MTTDLEATMIDRVRRLRGLFDLAARLAPAGRKRAMREATEEAMRILPAVGSVLPFSVCRALNACSEHPRTSPLRAALAEALRNADRTYHRESTRKVRGYAVEPRPHDGAVCQASWGIEPCDGIATHTVSWTSVHHGKPRRDARRYCRQHAVRFAQRNELRMPPEERMEGA